MTKFGIKGEYYIQINIPTMFHNYNMTIKGHNMVVNKGIEFFFKKAITPLPTQDETNYHTTTGVIGQIAVGTGEEETTMETEDLTNLSKKFKYEPTNIVIEDNTLTISTEANGSDLDGTTEIGVYTTQGVLISRDTHYAYELPTTSIIEIYYIYTMKNTEIIEEEEEED